jgi:hypothetical protein
MFRRAKRGAMLPAKPLFRAIQKEAVLMPPDQTPIYSSRFHERLLGVLIWCAFGVLGIAALYGCSLIMGD